ncbi:DUF4166 domain-containing protein [Oricola sp.]|uniref:DUF4166 domain-containing protein n=1 Tax=Oricola sp. TaxID=1979950 RepID=UPI00320BCA86|nr:DUF4166 domain-containing protein [Oricola sp.]
MKILIIGGYGVFGGRLAELLSDIDTLEILVGGRRSERAQEFCAAYRGAAVVRPLEMDRARMAEILARERPDLVVDASGPFQHYGAKPYVVVESCIDAGVNYLDFADSSEFVHGIAAFDGRARAAGVFVLSGVSSFPVLTAAVLRRISQTMEIVSVTGGIAPSPYAGIGMNVMRAVLGYAGTPVKLFRNGAESEAMALVETMRFTVAVPGRLPLRNTRFSLVDVPDLREIPPEHPALRDIWMGAGPVPEYLHRLLNLLASTRAAFGLPSCAPFAGLFHRVVNMMRYGEHRGGMFVHAQGLRDGEPAELTWNLVAEGDDGPYIPSMAIESLVRKLVDGERPADGARSAIRALELDDYERLFENRAIYAGFREPAQPGAPPYRQVLGPALDDLPAPIRAIHDTTRQRSWRGRARVRRGSGLVAGIIGRLIGFPAASDDVEVSVVMAPERGGERWTRRFGDRQFSSFQWPGAGKNECLMMERFGIVTVALALVVEDGRLHLVPRHWSCLGVPLPAFLLPRGNSFETVRGDRFCFDVEIAAPLIGLIVAYDGMLEPD